MSKANKPSRYMPGLDGLRALSVLSVIAYHLNLPWATGGFLGVTSFFVLSGYLITDLLIAEWSRNNTIDLKDFWIRRAKRLLPGMFTLLLILIALVSLFNSSLVSGLKHDSIAAIFYYSNWWYIFHQLSYFESFGTPSLLNHFWSLAVEEQFYIIWPILTFAILRFKKQKSILFVVTIALVMFSAVLMALLFHPGSDPSRVYYGTDTRAFSLLIGAGLALIWPSRKLTNNITNRHRFALDTVGITGLFIFLFMIGKTNQYDDFLYQGGMFILSIAIAMLIAALAHPASKIGRFLAMRPLKWVGLRSYGIYLWHFPVIVLLTPKINTGSLSIPRIVLQITIIFVLASLSFHFIEDPIRKGKLGSIWKKLRSGQWDFKNVCVKHIVLVSTFTILVAISFLGTPSVPSANGAKASSNLAIVQTNPKHSSQIVKNVKEKPNTTPIASHDKHGQESNQHKSSGQTTVKNNKPVTSHTASNNNKNKKIDVIGDSVVINSIPFLKKTYPTITVDAHIGRQFTEASKLIQQAKQSNSLGDIIIIELGTNGAFSKKQMISLINEIGKQKKIIFINTRVQRPWESVVNKTLKEVSAKFPNTTVVDWYKASANHNSYFSPDGVHLKTEGAKVYASLLIKAIQSLK